MNPRYPGSPAIALPQAGAQSVLASNKVIRNTYLLLSATLAFSALTAGGSAALKLPIQGYCSRWVASSACFSPCISSRTAAGASSPFSP